MRRKRKAINKMVANVFRKNFRSKSMFTFMLKV